jgi:hypothetical protein
MKKLFYTYGILLISICLYSQDSEYLIKERNIPEKYKPIFDFLESLKWTTKEGGGYDKSKTPNWSSDKITDYFSANGVLFIDPNDSYAKKLQKKQIVEELKNKNSIL